MIRNEGGDGRDGGGDAMKLPVYETFFSWQGEGCHMGKSAYFIRLYGCPVHCPWCDSAGTWDTDHARSTALDAGTRNPESRFQRICPRELAERAAQHRPQIVVITGGEPAIHDLRELTDCLREQGLQIHLETSGAFELLGTFDWVTVSPKEWKKPLLDCIVRANELKIIVDSMHAIEYWEKEMGSVWSSDSIWLHPEWSLRKDRAILQLINRKVKEAKHPYRAGYQLHKIYRVDEEDPHSRPPRPVTSTDAG